MSELMPGDWLIFFPNKSNKSKQSLSSRQCKRVQLLDRPGYNFTADCLVNLTWYHTDCLSMIHLSQDAIHSADPNQDEQMHTSCSNCLYSLRPSLHLCHYSIFKKLIKFSSMS